MTSTFVVSTIVSTFITSSYVLVLYIFPGDRPNGTYLKNRDNPIILRRRMTKICMMTMINLVVVCTWLQYNKITSDFIASLNLMGITPGVSLSPDTGFLQIDKSVVFNNLQVVTKDLSKFIILFIGPLINDVFINHENILLNFISEVSTLQGMRNYIIAPITEELVYTSFTLTLYEPYLTSIGDDDDKARLLKVMMLLTPGFFAFAHLNHGWDLYLSGSYQLSQILTSVTFQFSYTWLFGILTNRLFIEHHNVYSCIAVHSFCNSMGFPDIIPSRTIGVWKYCYWILLCLGVFYFAKWF